jgi:signal transduction histidine kinase
MTYQLVIDNSAVLTGSVASIVAIASVLLLIVAAVARLTWRKLRENQVIKYEFITIIAHKFRTPLTQVKWIADAVIQDERDPYKKKNFQDIQKANEKLIALMETLIELTGKDNGAGLLYTFERTVMYDFVRDVADTMKNAFQEKNISFSVQAADPMLAVVINRTGMRFVLQALLENSYTYSHPGRRVDVSIFRRHSKVAIAITDDGIGIRPQDLSKVFSKFYRAGNAKKMDTEGFGVSLFMAQSIVRRNKGRIVAYSQGIDHGSTFTIVLPRAK